MYSNIERLKHFINYKQVAQSSIRLHSPFLFEFYQKVLHDKTKYDDYSTIEEQRQLLKKDKRTIAIEDFGAGSRTYKTNNRTINQIAKTSLKHKKYAQLIYRICKYYNITKGIELGTSLGITTSYIAKGAPNATIYTIEGCNSIAQISQSTFNHLAINNIQPIIGNFDTILPDLLSKVDALDFVFIDGNHKYEPTIRYFNLLLPLLTNDGFIIIDDIHWSEEMNQAWEKIKLHPAITISIDLFEIGIVLIRNEKRTKEHFVLKF